MYQLFPGILHGALKVKVAMGSYAEMEYALKAGCCHAVSEVNRDAANFDWLSADVQVSFVDYIDKRALLLTKLLDEFRFSKNKSVIFIELNSFALLSIFSGPDYRQRLRRHDGSLMTFAESAEITAVYDRIYSQALRSQAFAVLQMNSS